MVVVVLVSVSWFRHRVVLIISCWPWWWRWWRRCSHIGSGVVVGVARVVVHRGVGFRSMGAISAEAVLALFNALQGRCQLKLLGLRISLESHT